MKKKREILYSLTLKGVLLTHLEDAAVEQVMDAIDLQLYRQKANAIVFDEDNSGGRFVSVELEGGGS